MKKRTTTGIALMALTPLFALGVSTAFGSSAPGSLGAAPAEADHPECYNETRLNDPNDFCYKTMGPWNSTKSSDEEVRSLISVDRMVAAGMNVQEIERYYPEYRPFSK